MAFANSEQRYIIGKRSDKKKAIAANRQLCLTIRFQLDEWNITDQNATFLRLLFFSKRIRAALHYFFGLKQVN